MPIINSKDFSKTIQSYISEYGDEVLEKNAEALETVAKEVTRDLKKAGDFGGTSFRKSIAYEMQTGRKIRVRAKIGAKAPYYRLTHLLEFGHATANGGRTKAFNFVKPINDTVEQRYIAEMERLLQ